MLVRQSAVFREAEGKIVDRAWFAEPHGYACTLADFVRVQTDNLAKTNNQQAFRFQPGRRV